MVFYLRKSAKDKRFHGRVNAIIELDNDLQPKADGEHEIWPVPDSVVLCNGCNSNLYPDGEVYMVYLSKTDLKKDHPYDCYCGKCLNNYFPTAKDGLPFLIELKLQQPVPADSGL